MAFIAERIIPISTINMNINKNASIESVSLIEWLCNGCYGHMTICFGFL